MNKNRLNGMAFSRFYIQTVELLYDHCRRRKGKKIYCYLDNDEAAFTVYGAMRLQEVLTTAIA